MLFNDIRILKPSEKINTQEKEITPLRAHKLMLTRKYGMESLSSFSLIDFYLTLRPSFI